MKGIRKLYVSYLSKDERALLFSYGISKSDIISAYNRAIKENRLVRLEGNIYSLMEELRETEETIVFKFEVFERRHEPDYVSLIEVIF